MQRASNEYQTMMTHAQLLLPPSTWWHLANFHPHKNAHSIPSSNVTSHNKIFEK